MEAPAEVMEAPAEKANTAKERKRKKQKIKMKKKKRRKGKGIPFVGPSIEGPTRVGPSI